MTLFFNNQTSWLYKLTNDINDKSLFASCVIWKRRMWDLIVKWVLNMNYIKIPTSDQSYEIFNQVEQVNENKSAFVAVK